MDCDLNGRSKGLGGLELGGVRLGSNASHPPPSEITCDSTIISCDSSEVVTVDGVVLTIREQFALVNEMMEVLYNNI